MALLGEQLPFLLDGFLINLLIAFVAMVLSLTIGLLLALSASSKRRFVSNSGGLWVDVWRNLPLIFILLYLFLGCRRLGGRLTRTRSGVLPEAFPIAFFLAAVIGFTLYNSAVIAEIMRAGILSLERGQGEAAAAIGLPYWRAMRFVDPSSGAPPDGARHGLAADHADEGHLARQHHRIQEVMRHARIVVSTSGSPFVGTGVDAPLLQVFLTVGIMFVIVNLTLSRLSRRWRSVSDADRMQVEKVAGLEDQLAIQTALPDER